MIIRNTINFPSTINYLKSEYLKHAYMLNKKSPILTINHKFNVRKSITIQVADITESKEATIKIMILPSLDFLRYSKIL